MRHPRFLSVLVLLALGSAAEPMARASTPDDPSVRAMVGRALDYLTTEEEDRLGGKCLIAMVFFKEGHDPSHPQIEKAVEACKAVCDQPVQNIREDIYSVGLAIIFLTELNPSAYRPQITKLLELLEIRQKQGGGWGYDVSHPAYGRTGDTSMTQYAVLAMWTARQKGIPVPQTMIVRVCNWLLRTQDPSGAWGYQGNDPGFGNFQRVEQSQIRPSLCAAGLGSTYICGDMLGFASTASPRRRSGRGQDELPPALRLVTKDGRPPPREGTRQVDAEIWRKATADGNRWFEKNYTIQPPIWAHYYLYALERYESFREAAEGVTDPEPQWYDDGVNLLARTQHRDGYWAGQGGYEVCTAFAVLFLIRSTQRSIQKSAYGEGRLTGGRGLPTSVNHVEVKRGRIISAPLGGSVADALAVLEDPSHPAYDWVTQEDSDIQLSDNALARSGQVARLRRVIKGGSYKARASAIRALARRRNLDDVPFLIRALSDPDPNVRREADRGLRLISRRLDGVEAGVHRDEMAARAARADAWKQWYLSIRPDAQFVE